MLMSYWAFIAYAISPNQRSYHRHASLKFWAQERIASGGVDRTVLRLSYKGHQPDTEVMRRLYDNPETITFGEQGTQETDVTKVNDPLNDPQNDKYDPQNSILKG